MRQGRDRSTTHFARGLDALPDAEETDQPDEEKAESKVPLESAQFVDSRRQAQHIAPSSKQSHKSDGAGQGPERANAWIPTGWGSNPASKLWNPIGLGK